MKLFKEKYCVMVEFMNKLPKKYFIICMVYDIRPQHTNTFSAYERTVVHAELFETTPSTDCDACTVESR